MFARLALALLILTAAIGCGGGSGSPVPDDGSTGSQELMVGNLSLRGSSPSEPAVVSANQTTVTSLSGDFSGVRLRYPSNLLENAQVVYGTEGHTLFSMDGDGARSEPYVTGNAIQAADYNPAGTKLYYGDSNLYVKTLSTGAVATLATGNVTDVAVSPNGAKIAYITYGGFGFYTIWVANADGSSATNVGGYSGITAIDWISNSKLVFTGSSSIRSINTDGSGVTTVISGD
ncbi:MAG TPA: hypothetical protein VK934_11685, partial [Fimbriimonas sp.]|nr:hypothetical protein [Fimbriimonas sp.]